MVGIFCFLLKIHPRRQCIRCLLWLYLSATMMIMGAEFNSVLMEMKTARG